MRTGTVKFFNESKGYGFITDEETGKDIFVHASGIRAEELREGDRVSYEEEEGRKGKVAAQVAVRSDRAGHCGGHRTFCRTVGNGMGHLPGTARDGLGRPDHD